MLDTQPRTELVKCGEDKIVIMIVDKIFEMRNGQWGASCLHVGLVALLHLKVVHESEQGRLS